MKSKLVIWGTNAQDEKILIAVALRAEDNKVDIYTFPESAATDDFYEKMMREWRDGNAAELTEGAAHQERDLSVSEGLLPDDLKTERTDLIQRAQTEWHFLVLSSRLHQSYEDEVADLKERVEQLEKFDPSLWDNLKGFWDKVQEQVKEHHLLREHADRLRDNTNALFAYMKQLRTKADDEFYRLSRESYEHFVNALQNVEKKVSEGARWQFVFDELKTLQRQFRQATDLSREHRAKVWQKLDGTFKNVKAKRFGGKPEPGGEEGQSAYQRLKRRHDGLLDAIEKMEASIQRDHNDLGFQRHKIATTDGQLEAQIRQAKIVMIEERVVSKEEKLKEMKGTLADLEKRLAQQKDRDERFAARQAAKEKIEKRIKGQAGETAVGTEAHEDISDLTEPLELPGDEEDTEMEPLAEPAEEMAELTDDVPDLSEQALDDLPAEEPKKGENIFSAIGAAFSEPLSELMDTAKATLSVVSEKLEERFEAIEDKIEDAYEKYTKKDEPETPETPAAETVGEQVSEAVQQSVNGETPKMAEATTEEK